MLDDHELDHLLRASSPRTTPTGITDLTRSVATEVTSQAPRRRPAARVRKLVIAGGLAVCIPTAAAAATVTIYHAHSRAQTGVHLPPGGENDTSEVIDMCAPDFPSYLATLEPTGFALPRGTTWDGIRRQILATRGNDCPPTGPGIEPTVLGLRLMYLNFSECPWEKAFLDARGTGASGQRRRAADAVAVVERTIRGLGADGDGGTREREAAAARADAAWFAHDYAVNCSGAPVSTEERATGGAR